LALPLSSLVVVDYSTLLSLVVVDYSSLLSLLVVENRACSC
jgi:hypothetical protein